MIKNSIYTLFILMFFASVNGVWAQDLSKQIRVSGEFHSLSWSNDSELLAAGGDDGIYIYDSTLQEITHLPAQAEGIVWQMTWSPDNHYLASVNFPGSSVQIWARNPTNNQFSLDRTITNSLGFKEISAIAWSPDGNHLAMVDREIPERFPGSIGAIEIWDTQTWLPENSIDHIREGRIEFPADFIVWSPDSTQLASAANICIENEVVHCINPYFYIVDALQGDTLYTSPFLIEYIYGMKWSSNSKLVIAEASDTYIFDTTSFQVTSYVRNYGRGFYGAFDPYWLPDNTDLVSVSYPENAVFVTNIATDAIRLQFPIDDFNVNDLSPDGTKLAVTHFEGHRLQIWDVVDLAGISGTATITPYPTITPLPFITPTAFPSR